MCEVDLDAIRARAEAATPGPWSYDTEPQDDPPFYETVVDGDGAIVARCDRGPRVTVLRSVRP